MGSLGICSHYLTPMLADDVRRAIRLSIDIDAAERMRRAGWLVEMTSRGASGKRGPAFSAR